MGLYKDSVQNIITGSYVLLNADDKRKASHIKREGTIQKRKKLSIKKHSIPRFWTRGLLPSGELSAHPTILSYKA
jgi:hypothetical protein